MNRNRLGVTLGVLTLIFLVSGSAFSQAVVTGIITGRAEDSSGALIPGVEVTIASPDLIIGGGSRTIITNEQGSYRVTQLPAPGVYTVTFSLPGFRTLNIEGVNMPSGVTRTVNGVLEVATVAETITVTSQAPTIDLEEATTVVNWGQKLMDELPYGRSIRALSRLIPGFTVTHFDVGGNTAGGSASFGAELYGRRGGDEINYEGMNWSGTFGDYGTYSEIQFETSAKGAEARTPGVNANHIIKSGSNSLHGNIMMAMQDASFQSVNISQNLLDKGLRPSDNAFVRYHDVNGDVGGPIIRNRLYFYYAHGNMYTATNVPGFEYPGGELQPYTTRLDFTTSKFTYQITDNQKLETAHQFSEKDTPWRGASTTLHPLAAQHQNSWSGIGPGLKWVYIVSPTMTVDVSFQRGGYWWPSSSHTNDIRQVDLNSGYTSGHYGTVYRRPIRWQWPINFSWFSDVGGTNNEVKIGYMGWYGTRTTHTEGYPNQQIYHYESTDAEAAAKIWYNNPERVEIYDFPNTERYNNYYDTFFMNDKVTVNRHLTLNLGFRWESYGSSLPKQGRINVGPFSSGSTYPSRERDEFPSYTSIVPRLSMIYDITGEGTMALKFSYGKYASESRDARRVNPNARTRWRYEWDGTIPFVPNKGPDGIFGNSDDPELQSISGGGGLASVRDLDPNLDNLTMDEYTAGIEMAFGPNYVFRFSLIRKEDKGGYKTINRALPYSAYTDVAYGVDIGRDNVAGTSDDKVIELWAVPRSHPGYGKRDEIFMNYDEKEGRDMYTAWDFALNRAYSSGYTFTVTHTSSFAKRRMADPQNPNQLIHNYAQQFPEWDHVFKANGVYDMPYGIKYSTTFINQMGAYYNRTTRMRDARNRNQTVLVEGQVGRYDTVRLWDNRVSKTFQVNDTHSIEMMFDMYNTLNSSAIIRHENRNGPNYLKPLASSAIDAAAASPILSARIFRLGMRWRF